MKLRVGPFHAARRTGGPGGCEGEEWVVHDCMNRVSI